jgi:tRNA threonylcarbamoyl adenosine modification protein (Sua5/YciO/YrdC/YwlC family)
VFYDITRKYWPGPLTIIVKASSRLPLKVTANTGNVALRVPAARIPVEIIRAAGVPITATSANISGASECTTAEGVREQLGGRISLIVDGGASPREVASTIIDMSNPDHPTIQREGAIPESELAEFLR